MIAIGDTAVICTATHVDPVQVYREWRWSRSHAPTLSSLPTRGEGALDRTKTQELPHRVCCSLLCSSQSLLVPDC